jgi:hypothetical protein
MNLAFNACDIESQLFGIGSTNSLNVIRSYMGSVASAHTVGAAVTVLSGDYIIKDNAPNLFEICGNNFAAVLDQNRRMAEIAKEIDIPADRYFNAGFMYLTKDVLDRTRDILLSYYIKKEYPWQGQGLLNKMLYDQGIDFIKLNSKEWNRVKGTFGLYADHYAGTKKKRWGEVIYSI